MKARGSQSKYWCFTVNSPKCIWGPELRLGFEIASLADWEWEEDPARWAGVDYAVWQLERAPETGRLHLQGYLELTNRGYLTKVKKLRGLEGAHLEARRGSPKEAKEYCRKPESRVAGPWETGVWVEEAHRKDQKTKATEQLVARVRAGASDPELWEEFPSLMLIHNRSVVRAREAFGGAKRNSMPIVFLFCGPGGTGKSRTATAIAEYLGDVYVVPTAKSSGLYFDGYRQERSIILDDMDGARCTPGFFKQLCDRYAFSVPVHGAGNVNFNSPYIFITTNRVPKDWWKNQSKTERAAVMRRFACIRFFGSVRTKGPVRAQGAPEVILNPPPWAPGFIVRNRE